MHVLGSGTFQTSVLLQTGVLHVQPADRQWGEGEAVFPPRVQVLLLSLWEEDLNVADLMVKWLLCSFFFFLLLDKLSSSFSSTTTWWTKRPANTRMHLQLWKFWQRRKRHSHLMTTVQHMKLKKTRQKFLIQLRRNYWRNVTLSKDLYLSVCWWSDPIFYLLYNTFFSQKLKCTAFYLYKIWCYLGIEFPYVYKIPLNITEVSNELKSTAATTISLDGHVSVPSIKLISIQYKCNAHLLYLCKTGQMFQVLLLLFLYIFWVFFFLIFA